MAKLDLSPEGLLTAYANGVFPMDYNGEIVWFAPDPRAIIELDAFHIPATLRRTYAQQRFQVHINREFEAVVRACADRPDGTWISQEISAAYVRLYALGFAYSVEAWRDDRLVGGLYGVSIGGAFFGESMFHQERDASKIALVYLVERLRQRGFALLDIQFMTAHLERFGAVEIPRRIYLRRLHQATKLPCRFI
ncbi:MAG TPA: leucyl/phenylalanyl-tRNA--protein transferase [Phycisphaerae bacterium]|jgi:leucyl/phenylalanyl-tRNA--protein transferase